MQNKNLAPLSIEPLVSSSQTTTPHVDVLKDVITKTSHPGQNVQAPIPAQVATKTGLKLIRFA